MAETSSVLQAYRFDLGRQDSGTPESNFALYATRQFQVTVANVAVVDVSTGPRMKPFEDWAEDVAVKPFLTGRDVAALQRILSPEW